MPKLTRRFDLFGPLPYDPDVTRTYKMVPGNDPLDALSSSNKTVSASAGSV